MENNKIELLGKVSKSFEFEYDAYGENFYSLVLDVERTSGVTDKLKLICSDKIINVNNDITDEYIYVSGSIRTRNNDGHLIINVFVDDLDVLYDNKLICENNVILEGFICKKADSCRNTPLGRVIFDQSLAVNRRYNKSDYLPLVYWGRNAKFIEDVPVGTKLKVCGRLQSRDYVKQNGETNTAYEVSVQSVEIMELD